MELFPGIHHLRIPTRTLPPHRSTNSYVVSGPNTALVIDAVCPGGLDDYNRIFKNNRISIGMAAITHPHLDHYIGLVKALEKFGGKIVCHFQAQESLERVFARESFGKYLKGGEVFRVGDYTVRVLHTPGHCPEHICLYLEEEKILFSGDTVLGFGTSIISPPQGDMIAYMRSLESLSRLDVRFIFPGHGPIIDKRTNERIQWYIKHRQTREHLIVEALSGALLTPSDIAEKIYTDEDFRMHGQDLLPRAERTVLAHLLKLEKEGRVVSLTRNGSTVFSLL